MTNLGHLTDSDIFPHRTFPGVREWTERRTVKIVITDTDGRIALITNPIHQCHLLPGGGIEDKEDILDAANREAQEETSTSITNAQILGSLTEEHARDGKQYTTYLVIAQKGDQITEDLRTEEERNNGLTVGWHTPEEAEMLMNEQEERLHSGTFEFYNTGFNIVRDRKFIEYTKSHN